MQVRMEVHFLKVMFRPRAFSTASQFFDIRRAAMSSTRSLAVASWLLCFVSAVVSVSTISTVGSEFYDSNGNQFYIKGR